MKKVIENNHINEQTTRNNILLEARLEQLGYQCLSHSCEQFTTLRFVPKEIKRKEELIAPPSE